MAIWHIPERGKKRTVVVERVVSTNATNGTKTIVDTKGRTHILWAADYSSDKWNKIGPGTKIKLTIGVTKAEVV